MAIQNCLPKFGSTGDFQMTQDIEVIFQSIFVILNTPIGGRVWQPEFGCDVKKYLFDLLDNTTLDNMKQSIQTALATWEPRITVNEVIVEANKTDTKAVNATIKFTYADNEYTKTVNVGENSDLSVYDILG